MPDALAQIGGLTHSTPTPEPTSLTLLTLSTLLLTKRRRTYRNRPARIAPTIQNNN